MLSKKLSIIFVLLIVVSLISSPVVSSEEITIRFGDAVDADHPHTTAWEYFADEVAELSDGRIEVEVHPAAALGGHSEMNRSLQMGTLEMTKSSNAALTSFVEETEVFNFPYLFEDKEHYFEVLDGPIGQEFLKEIYPEEGFYGLFYTDSGARSIYNNQRPINSPEDLDGLSIRVMESDIMIDTLEAMGASAPTIALEDLYDGMRTGVVDGAENSPILYEAMNHYEEADYLSLTKHFMSPDVVLVSKSFWDSLDEADQEIIKEASEKTKEYQREMWAEMEEEAIESLEEKGVKVNNPDYDFSQEVESVYEEHAEKYMDIIEEIRSYKE
ncbi:MAG: TRAP transporter substrate-binding protein [bacterium]